MVFNATFNNISVISLPTIILVGETGVPGETFSKTPYVQSAICVKWVYINYSGYTPVELKKRLDIEYINI
jgi:hypothetical protein